jgi:hypothetical protein
MSSNRMDHQRRASPVLCSACRPATRAGRRLCECQFGHPCAPAPLHACSCSQTGESTSSTQSGHSSRKLEESAPLKAALPTGFHVSSVFLPSSSPLHLSDTRLSGSTTPIFSLSPSPSQSTVHHSGFLLDTSRLCIELLLTTIFLITTSHKLHQT